MSRRVYYILVALTALSPFHAEAQQTPRPERRAHHALVYDSASSSVLLFGGSTQRTDGQFAFFGDLWRWNGRGWTLVTEQGGVNVSGHRLFVDPGGRLTIATGFDGRREVGGTLRWHGGTWTSVADDTSFARAEAAGAYDVHRKRYVLYGGLRGRNAQRTTWEYDGERWSRVAADGPPPLFAAAMAYDEARRVTILFGGKDSARRDNGETWAWDGARWQRLATSGPSPRMAPGMAYDARRRRIVLFGGGDSAMRGDTWLWDGRAWKVATQRGPSPRMMPYMAYDRARGVTVMFGGRQEGMVDSDETWEWNGAQWRRVDPAIGEQTPKPSLAAPAMTATGAFFALSVADMDASERWYRDTLGLSVIMKAPRTDATKAAATVLQGGGLTVELVRHDEAVPLTSVRRSSGGALYVHGIFKVGVIVDDYDTALANIRARGIPIAIGPFPARADQPANFIIRDNAGNYIQVIGRR